MEKNQVVWLTEFKSSLCMDRVLSQILYIELCNVSCIFASSREAILSEDLFFECLGVSKRSSL